LNCNSYIVAIDEYHQYTDNLHLIERKRVMDKYLKIIISLMATIFILGLGTFVFADRDKGYGYQGSMHHGQERHHRGYGMFGDLSENQIQKLDEEHTAFREATKELRQQIYQKKLELASEVAKQKPDVAAAAALQQEISGLLAQLAQSRLEHFLRVQKINPDAGRGGPMGFGMMGPGMMHRGMMGPDGYGGRKCPGSGYRGGYGMGSDMMGPGYGRSPGMMRSYGNRGMDPA
jgi:Spy/CpxP family protein refolding chaperone